jgi:hypothetical protein
MESKSPLGKYWYAYGGFTALIKSKYFWFSIAYTLILFRSWAVGNQWWNDVLSIVPGLLGFSLGGFAIWVAIGDDKFRSLIVGSEDPKEPSPFMEINATFAHFIVVQIIAIFLALFAKSYFFSYQETREIMNFLGEWAWVIYISKLLYFICYFFFIYAIASGLATVFALFSVSSWYDEMKSQELQSENNNSKLDS